METRLATNSVTESTTWMSLFHLEGKENFHIIVFSKMDVCVHKVDAKPNVLGKNERGRTRLSVHPFLDVHVYFQKQRRARKCLGMDNIFYEREFLFPLNEKFHRNFTDRLFLQDFTTLLNVGKTQLS